MVLARIVFVSTLFSGCDNNCDDEDMISLLIQRNLDHIICKIFREEKIYPYQHIGLIGQYQQIMPVFVNENVVT